MAFENSFIEEGDELVVPDTRVGERGMYRVRLLAQIDFWFDRFDRERVTGQ